MLKGLQRSTQSKALFVRRGSYSHVNACLLDALRRARPDIHFDDLDLNDLMSPMNFAFQKSIIGTIAEYGPGSVRTRQILRYRMLRSKAFYQITKGLIRAASTRHDYMFTVQTQSLFNAANGIVPNFVYTDNVSLDGESSEWYKSPGEPSRGWLELEADIYRDAAHVFTFGSQVRRVLVERYGMAESKVTCCGAGANVVSTSPPDFDHARYARRNILFAGIDWERKGGPDLIAAFVKLRSRLPDATLTIVGCTPTDAVGVPGCETLGRVTMEKLAQLYRAASCLCVPSRHEPFGNVFVEAGHFGLPVVATTVGEIGDVVHDGENGFRVPPGSPDALANALWRLLHDPDVARRMGKAGVRVTTDYSWDTVATRILAQASVPPASQAE